IAKQHHLAVRQHGLQELSEMPSQLLQIERRAAPDPPALAPAVIAPGVEQRVIRCRAHEIRRSAFERRLQFACEKTDLLRRAHAEAVKAGVAGRVDDGVERTHPQRPRAAASAQRPTNGAPLPAALTSESCCGPPGESADELEIALPLPPAIARSPMITVGQ